MIWPIEAGRERHLGNGHADGIAKVLSQGVRGGFHAGRLAVFRVAWSRLPHWRKCFSFGIIALYLHWL
jgi:hypothetical protein